MQDFPGSQVVKTSPSNAGDMSLIPGRGIKIPQALWQKKKMIRKHIVINSIQCYKNLLINGSIKVLYRTRHLRNSGRLPRRDGVCVRMRVRMRVQLFATPWTVAHQAPLSMGFSRQEY